jgi:SAM-dependent methyltransferase
MRADWESSAQAWIDALPTDETRRVCDPHVLSAVDPKPGERILDLGCGEGRMLKKLQASPALAYGVDLTQALLKEATKQDAAVARADAEHLPFADGAFHTVLCYLALLDFPNYAVSVREMARVTRSGGKVVLLDLAPFFTAPPMPWVKDEEGRYRHRILDGYAYESGARAAWKGISVVNYHRPAEMVFGAFLGAGLSLEHLSEPKPSPDQIRNREVRTLWYRVPMAWLTVWRKPA